MSATTTRKAAAPRAAAAKKTTAAPVRKAGPGPVLDLDALSKREAMPGVKLPTRPFTFLLNGVDYELQDPRDCDWKLTLELSGNPFLLMRTCLVNADEPIDEPTEMEIRLCRERMGLTDEETAMTAELVADGKVSGEERPPEKPVIPALIDRFTAVDMPGWKLNTLFSRWHEHYKIDLSGGKGILDALLGKTE